MPLKTGWHIILDGLLLALLSGYVIAGYRDVPFHGDESMQLYMSRDYYHMVQTHDIEALYYREALDAEIDQLNQELRIINGTVNKLTIGLAWDLAGFTVNDLNQPWYWGMPDEWAWNVANHGLPSDRLLYLARLPSTLLTALSVIVIFAITWLITHSHTASNISAFIYATYPAVLLNGRRAMMEGSFLCFSALVILCAVMLCRADTPRRRLTWAILLGITSGLAIASKHTALLTVLIGFLAVAARPVVQRMMGKQGDQSVLGLVMPLAVAGIMAGGMFLALNPAWWSNPPGTAAAVLDSRRELLDQQIVGTKATGDYYDNSWQRVKKLVDQGVGANPPQYYEVPYWAGYVGDQIVGYESGWLDGRSDHLVWTIVLLLVFSFGIIALVKRWADGPAWIGLIWLAGTVVALLVLIPLDWQRYYLPLFAPISVTGGIGAGYIISWIRQIWMSRHQYVDNR